VYNAAPKLKKGTRRLTSKNAADKPPSSDGLRLAPLFSSFEGAILPAAIFTFGLQNP
jgi:hypothetical protein